MKSMICELCTENAATYCASDSAFLCLNCDSNVHGANFLVSRHVRRTICSKCDRFVGNCVSGVLVGQFVSVCRSCSSEFPEPNDTDSSPYSSCVSSTDQSFATEFCSDRLKPDVISSSSSVITAEDSVIGERANKIQFQARSPARVLVDWSRILGLNEKLRDRVTSRAFSVCLTALTVLPYRVALAASFWSSLRLAGDRSACDVRNLRRLEEITGVSAELIVRAESNLGRVLRDKKTLGDLKEGWAENSV